MNLLENLFLSSSVIFAINPENLESIKIKLVEDQKDVCNSLYNEDLCEFCRRLFPRLKKIKKIKMIKNDDPESDVKMCILKVYALKEVYQRSINMKSISIYSDCLSIILDNLEIEQAILSSKSVEISNSFFSGCILDSENNTKSFLCLRDKFENTYLVKKNNQTVQLILLSDRENNEKNNIQGKKQNYFVLKSHQMTMYSIFNHKLRPLFIDIDEIKVFEFKFNGGEFYSANI